MTAIADASDGRMGDSTRAVGLGYEMSESLREEPNLIGCLVRIACIAITSSSLKQSAQYGDISEPQARRLFDLLGKIGLQSGYVKAMKGERAQGLDLMERVRNHIIDINSVVDPATKPVNARRTGIGAWLIDLRACRDELFYMDYMDRVVDAADEPYRNRIAQQAASEPDFPKYALMSAIVIPVSAKSKQALYDSMATLAGDRAFVAVLAYRAKFGGYPSNLKQVEEKAGWKLPLDPMMGDQFHYRREGKGFVLYGLGKNMKDDNAKTVENLPESIQEAVPRNDRYTDFRDKYPYSNGDGRHSADMIWRINR